MDDQQPDVPETGVVNGGVVDGCGCVAVAPQGEPNPQTVEEVPAEAAAGRPDESATGSQVGVQRRPLKLVVTLQPLDQDGYRAVLALGSADCDPLFRVIDAPDLLAVLGGVPSLVADAETRWITQPRYSNARPAPKVKLRAEEERATGGPAMTSPPEPTPAQPKTESRSSTPAKPSGQLSLFG